MSSVKYPDGLNHGDMVRLLHDHWTRGGEHFKAGEALRVGSVTRSRNGLRGRPRLLLVDPAKPWNWDGKGASARCINGIEVRDVVKAEVPAP